ncbi:TVP38/TMEM64 family protein [Aquibacillus rhizosphaerae]|uniref:TVP38/TMEM64 family membrane protein n=1 Tax=Aquibacillus rhizosphaerae TaxID=3051431 RepID=A0ABT7L1T7_9BACI|nr:VTT domain-containing protein [Aquibacillus sp. LR5S19]MDL4839777.1 VTT domain-containing protein [Aquibacillus sp. LR5S19]
MKQLSIAIIYVILLIIGFIYRENVIDWVQGDNRTDIPFMLFCSAFLSSIPIIPFTIFAGLMGVKYGVFFGFLINMFGVIFSSLIYYLIARNAFKDFFQQYIHRFTGMNNFNELIQKNDLFTLLLARMIFLFPYVLINIYAGINKISLRSYITATLFGSTPPMFILAFGGNKIFTGLPHFIIGLTSYAILLVMLFFGYRYWLKRKVRYSALK